ncbi:hypothetical protein ACPCSG_21675 [Streptomyces cellulosae]|jgi:hypothetical protein
MAGELPQVDIDTIRRTCNRMVDAGQLSKDTGGRYYPDTETRTQGSQEVSEVSGCPVTSADQPEPSGQSELNLSGLSGAGEAEGMTE